MNKYPPECPFCGRYVLRPEKIKTGFGDVLGGRCICDAVYVCDPTGHNTGEAYMEALAMAKGDWDIGQIGEEIDYLADDMDYDFKNHMRLYSGGMGEARGRLVFVKLKGHDALHPKGESTFLKEYDKKAEAAGQMDRKGDIKSRIINLLKTCSYDEIAETAKKDKGVIRRIIALAYDKEDVLSWRAIEAMGIIAGRLSGERIDVIRDTIRRLLWSMGEESGGIGWSSAEMLGEIIRSDPDEFADIIPIVWSFKEEDMFRPGVLRAMGRIADVRPDLVAFISKDLRPMLSDKNPAVRAYAVWVIGKLGIRDFFEDIASLSGDNSIVSFYQDFELAKKTVGCIVREVSGK